MADTKPYKVAILWRGDHEARRNATPQNNRYQRIFEELAALGIHAEPVVYADDIVSGAAMPCASQPVCRIGPEDAFVP